VFAGRGCRVQGGSAGRNQIRRCRRHLHCCLWVAEGRSDRQSWGCCSKAAYLYSFGGDSRVVIGGASATVVVVGIVSRYLAVGGSGSDDVVIVIARKAKVRP